VLQAKRLTQKWAKIVDLIPVPREACAIELTALQDSQTSSGRQLIEAIPLRNPI